MAVGAQALKIFEAGLMPGRHISDLGCIVVYFDTGISQLAIDLGGLKLATLAEELAMILTELGFLGVSQAGGALPAEMGCQLGITLCPELILKKDMRFWSSHLLPKRDDWKASVHKNLEARATDTCSEMLRFDGKSQSPRRGQSENCFWRQPLAALGHQLELDGGAEIWGLDTLKQIRNGLPYMQCGDLAQLRHG